VVKHRLSEYLLRSACLANAAFLPQQSEGRDAESKSAVALSESVASEAVLVKKPLKAAALLAGSFGSVADVAAVIAQKIGNVRPLKLHNRTRLGLPQICLLRRQSSIGGRRQIKIAGMKKPWWMQNDGALDGSFEFPDISGPGVRHQSLHRAGAEAESARSKLRSVFRKEMIREQRNV